MAENTVPSVPRERRLTDLYRKGKEVTIGDDDGAITVYLSKVSQIENKKAVEKAQAVRVRHLRLLHAGRDDPGRAPYEDQLYAFGLDNSEDLILLANTEVLQDETLAIIARLSEEEGSEWAKDGYLTSLQEAWNGGSKSAFQLDPEDPEAKEIATELLRFEGLVEEEVEIARRQIIEAQSIRPTEDLMYEATNRVIEAESNTIWTEEFNRWRLFYSVRYNDERAQRYFVNRQEIDALDEDVYAMLWDNFQSVVSTVPEAKS